MSEASIGGHAEAFLLFERFNSLQNEELISAASMTDVWNDARTHFHWMKHFANVCGDPSKMGFERWRPAVVVANFYLPGCKRVEMR